MTATTVLPRQCSTAQCEKQYRITVYRENLATYDSLHRETDDRVFRNARNDENEKPKNTIFYDLTS